MGNVQQNEYSGQNPNQFRSGGKQISFKEPGRVYRSERLYGQAYYGERPIPQDEKLKMDENLIHPYAAQMEQWNADHPKIDIYNIDDREVFELYNDRRDFPKCQEAQNTDDHLRRKYKPILRAPAPKPKPKPKPVKNLDPAGEEINRILRGFMAREDFKKNKNNMKQEGDDFVRSQKQNCELKGKANTNEYNLNGWEEFYPDETDYYNYQAKDNYDGFVRVENPDTENVEIYEGPMDLDELKEGLGKVTTADGEKKGIFRSGELEGWVIDSKRNGNTYEGKYENGNFNGKGYLRNKTKNSEYRGDFVDGKREGDGELTNPKIYYKGQFQGDKKNGKGFLKFKERDGEYDGDFENDQISGQGIFTWGNGDRYVGEMKNGKMDGRGKYYYANGQVFEGQYKEGKKHGKGKIYYADKKEVEADFDKGKIFGSGKYKDREGNVQEIDIPRGKVSKSVFKFPKGQSIAGSMNPVSTNKIKQNDNDNIGNSNNNNIKNHEYENLHDNNGDVNDKIDNYEGNDNYGENNNFGENANNNNPEFNALFGNGDNNQDNQGKENEGY